MKNVKNLIVYLIIALLCIAAFAGFLFTRKSGTDKAASAGTSTVTASNQSEDDKQQHVKDVMANSVKTPDPNPVVGIGRGTDYAKVTSDAISNAGGLKDIIKKGSVVLIKPNLCFNAQPDTPITTDYRVVTEVVNEVKQLGAGRVIIAEGCFTGNALDDASLRLNKFNTIQGVEFYNFNDCEKKDCYEVSPKKSLVGKPMYIPKVYMDADVVIDIAKLKTHDMAVVTLSLKNLFGVPSEKIYGGMGEKDGLHDLDMDKAIVELNTIRKADFSVIDGIISGENSGPVSNTPVNSNIVFAGKDPVALDTVALNFMGFTVDKVPHVKLAAEQKLGISDLTKIKINGADLNSIKMDFKSPFK
ncbi:MAG: DUF362 domain-containing protein [Bacillota bacterium]|nr:DUF362 domain-containing protein [Bacillota bacterium]